MRLNAKTAAILLFILLTSMLMVNLQCEKVAAKASPSKNTTQTLQTTVDGKNVTLTINGNVSLSQITDFSFMNLPDRFNNTYIEFRIRNLNGSAAFMNITIPKNAVLGGTAPSAITTGHMPDNSEGFVQDEKNFYVWFTTLPEWDNHNVSGVTILFSLLYHHNQPAANPLSIWLRWALPIAILTAGVALLLVAVKQKYCKIPS